MDTGPGSLWPAAACLSTLAVLLVTRWLLAPRKSSDVGHSCLYVGRVWHARFVPAVHKFAYSLFYTYLDLDHLDETFDGLWPLASHKRAAIAQFREIDHLKDVPDDVGLPLAERVRRLVERATGTRPQGPVCLMTHLSYMGYCFNPVSFYYCLDAATGKHIETIVAEVSNTPWGEMHCYVLNPSNKSVAVRLKGPHEESKVDPTVTQNIPDPGKGERVWNYVFSKAFHVSPFMEMDHTYDWDFKEPAESVWVSTAMLKGKTRWFQARFDMTRRSFDRRQFLWMLIRHPLITWAVQYLIHLQAFYLWLKKVPFYSHPQGTETWASNLVGTVMTPFFKLQEWMNKAPA